MKCLQNKLAINIWVITLLLPCTMLAQEEVDLFIWAGQSNAQGWTGDGAYYPENEQELDSAILLNWTFHGRESSGGKWGPMQAQRGRYAAGHFGPEVSFGREMVKAGKHPAIFKYCLGATGLKRDWKAPGAGGIYDQMIEKLQLAIADLEQQAYQVNIRGFVWIQGESDAGDEAAATAYFQNLSRMIDHLREEVLHQPDLKVILGVDEQHAYVRERPIIVHAQKRLANEDRNILYTSMYGLPKADATHLTPAGLVKHGLRIFNAYQLLAENESAETPVSTFADSWEYIGIAVNEPGYTIWGTSPIIGEDGKVHLFVARWPCELKVDPGWRTHSEIAHYVGDSPEGPFVFSDVAVKGEMGETKGKAPHNPAIHKVEGGYALFYIANDGLEKHPANQYICLSTAKSLYGPWEKAGKDGVILRPPHNPSYWNHQASNGVNNPALLPHPDGGFFLYFKSEKARMGLAVAEKLEGPYVQMPFPVTSNDRNIEDGYAFRYNDKFALLTTDNHGMIEEGGGILWTSEDGIHFDQYEKGFHRINTYTSIDMDKVAVHYGPTGRAYAKFERPQILIIDGQPAYLYVPSGTNIYGGECTLSYVLKFK